MPLILCAYEGFKGLADDSWCKLMRLRSNQPGRFFTTAKTHEFESISDITVEQLKLRTIIDQTGTYIYKASKVVAKYLGLLAKNDMQ